jgi:hypothetical protein
MWAAVVEQSDVQYTRRPTGQCTEDTGKLYAVKAGSSSQGDVVVRTAGYVLFPVLAPPPSRKGLVHQKFPFRLLRPLVWPESFDTGARRLEGVACASTGTLSRRLSLGWHRTRRAIGCNPLTRFPPPPCCRSLSAHSIRKSHRLAQILLRSRPRATRCEISRVRDHHLKVTPCSSGWLRLYIPFGKFYSAPRRHISLASSSLEHA